MDEIETVAALVIGAGPAGLMAAEMLAAAGHPVVLAEAMPTPARKMLMAGKSGLNITKSEPLATFAAAYPEGGDWLAPHLAAFGPEAVQDWMRRLGQEPFTGSTGRVFPKAMKASPLLRTWLTRLAPMVHLRTRWRWQGWDGGAAIFATPDGPRRIAARATVLALGGASWSRLGSDGAWTAILTQAGVALDPWRPSNVGLRVDWSPHMSRQFGAPVKGVATSCAGRVHRGEFVISRHGLEGAGIYALGPAIRDGAPVLVDLLPDMPEAQLADRLARLPAQQSLVNRLRRLPGLSPAKIALLQEFGRPLPPGSGLAARIKALPLRHAGPRPLDEAISVAGGIRLEQLDKALMLRVRPGVFAAGEMLAWDAPTGGYLLTACLATGRAAGLGAVSWLGGASDEAAISQS